MHGENISVSSTVMANILSHRFFLNYLIQFSSFEAISFEILYYITRVCYSSRTSTNFFILFQFVFLSMLCFMAQVKSPR